MNEETTYRKLVLILGVLFLTIGVYFRLRSQATREPLARREEGLFILIALRLCGLTAWAAVIAYLIDPASMRWASFPLPAGLRLLGAGVGVGVAAPLLFWTFRSLGKNLTDTVVTRRAHTLVTFGPYHWVRHPFYGVVVLMLISVSLLTANAFIALVGVAAVTLLVLRTPIEERKLVERFGDQYREYMARTSPFVPGFRRSGRG